MAKYGREGRNIHRDPADAAYIQKERNEKDSRFVLG